MPNDDDTLAHPEQPRFLLATWLWAVVLFVFFGAIVAITFGTMPRGSNYEDERGRVREEKLKAAREEWQKAAHGYAWVDKDKGVTRIPIDRAMELEMTALQTRKPVAAGPIATPAAEEVPVTATGAGQPGQPVVTAPPTTSPTPPPVSVTGPNSEIRGQPAAAANPPDAVPATQPGANATPAASPNQNQVAPVTPTVTPVQHTEGTPLPVRGASPAQTSPAATATPAPNP